MKIHNCSFKDALCCFASASVLCMAAPSLAAAQNVAVDIESQPLGKALNELSRQTDIVIVAPTELVSGKTAPAVSGDYSVDTALNRMLGSSLAFERDASGAIILQAALQETGAAQNSVRNDGAVVADEIIVQGFRGSTKRAQDLKREAVGSQDSIVAEDIADFPDLNLAESLQRIPGVTITRDNGEGRQIALRGLAAEFTRTQINGVEALATTNSVFDSRGSASRTRNFDFNIFASELFDQVDVYKSFEARQDEGGIAGTVDLRTPKPFDYDGFEAVFVGKGSYNDQSEAVKPRLAGLVSNRWGDFGALVSVAYSETDTTETGYRDWGWRPFTRSSFGPDITPEQEAILTSGDLIGPRATTYTTVNRIQERLGVTGALQWNPTARAALTVDALYGRLENADNEFNIAALGTGTINAFEADANNTVVFAEYLDADIRSEAKYSTTTTEFYQVVFNGDFDVSDRLTVNTQFGIADSVFDSPVHDKIFLQAIDHTFSLDYRGGRRQAINTYDFDIADASFWDIHRADLREDRIENEFTTAEINATWELNDFHNLQFGAQFKDYNSSGYERRDDVRDLNGSGIPYDAFALDLPVIAPYTVADVEASFPNIIAADLTGRVTGLPFSRDLTEAANRLGTAYELEEETYAGYAQYNFQWDFIRGNVGLRYVSTDITSTGESLLTRDADGDGTPETSFVPVTISNSYAEWLPSLNVAMDLTDNLVLRFSASRNISRPNLNDLRAAANVNIAGNSVSNGNPELEPFIASNFEGSAEYYFGEVNFVALGLYSKDLVSFIVSESRTVPFEETGLPLEFLTEDRVGEDFTVSQPINGDGGTIQGLEFAFQYEFIPGLGLIGNYTYADGETDYVIDGNTIEGPLLQLSKHAFNLTGYYENDLWGVRASAAYRDDYLTAVSNSANRFRGVNETLFVDAAAFINVTDRIKLTFEGINLTDEDIDQFDDPVADRPLVNTTSGRTFLAGATVRL